MFAILCSETRGSTTSLISTAEVFHKTLLGFEELTTVDLCPQVRQHVWPACCCHGCPDVCMGCSDRGVRRDFKCYVNPVLSTLFSRRLIAGVVFVLGMRPAGAPPVYTTGLPIIGPFLKFAGSPIGAIRAAYEKVGHAAKGSGQCPIEVQFCHGPNSATRHLFSCSTGPCSL